MVVVPPSPLPGMYVSAHYTPARVGAKAFYYMGYWERVKDFFELPPKHDLEIGTLVTCTCHGGIAVVLELYDNPINIEYPKMNMAKIWWIRSLGVVESRVWMHTIARLKIYKE